MAGAGFARSGVGAARRTYFRLKDQVTSGIAYLNDYSTGYVLDRASEAAHYDPRTGQFASTYGTETYGSQLLSDLHDPSAVSWDPAGTPDVVTGLADHEGGSTGFSLTDNDGAAYERVSQSKSIATTERHRAVKLVLYLKKDLASTAVPEIGFDPNANAALRFQVRPTDGAVAVRNSPATDEPWTYSVTDVGGWFRIEIIRYLNGDANTGVNTLIWPSVCAPAGLGSATSSATGTNTFAFGSDGGVFFSTADVAWLHDNTPRIFSDGAVLIEGSRTNLLDDNRDFPSEWVPSATRSSTKETGPDGAGASDRITCNASGLRHSESTGVATIAGTMTRSLFAKRVSGTDYVLLARTYDGIGRNDVFTISDEWARYHGSQSYAAGASSICGVGNLSEPGAGTKTFDVDLDQLEAGAYPSSPIRTSGATATRLGERLQTTISAELAAAMRSPEGFWFDYWPNRASSEAGANNATMFDVDAGSRFRVYHNGVTGGQFRLQSGGVVATTGALAFSAGDQLRFHVTAPVVGAWTLAVENLTAGGSVSASGTPTAVGALEGETLTVGNYVSGDYHIDGVISRFWQRI